MSLSCSPAIEVDCRLPRAVPIALSAACLLPFLLLSWVFRNPGVTLAALAAVPLVLFFFHRTAWLGAQGLTRASWACDGHWWLTHAGQAAVPARLRSDSRVFSAWLWLKWDTPQGPRQTLLLRQGLQAGMVRRLAVRLRLQGLAPAPEAGAVSA